MKKLITAFLATITLSLLPLTVYADIGKPQFDNWFVVCGISGYDYKSESSDGDSVSYFDEHLEPGTRYQVYSYNDSSKEYLLVPKDSSYHPKGNGYIYMTRETMNQYFKDATKAIAKENGKKQKEETSCIVSSDGGASLRQGPAKTFSEYAVIPRNTKLTYQYTYEYGGHLWGYTTYNGKSGWVNLGQTKAVTQETTTIRPTTTVPTTVTEPPSSETETETEVDPDPEPGPSPEPEPSSEAHKSERSKSSPSGGSSSAKSKIIAANNQAEPSGADPDANEPFEEQEPGQEGDEKGGRKIETFTITKNAGFFSNAKGIVIACCIGAVILAATAVIVLRIIKKNNNEE